jgi:prepilin-type N-terminal cleavage/methylation domain-containing protein
MRKFYKKHLRGFTLIELLIVIAVIAILAAFAFVALNPLARFEDARNVQRWADVNAYMEAIKLWQVDHGGAYFDAINNLAAGAYYQIGVGDECNTTCSNPTIILQELCADMEELIDGGYLAEILIDPNASGADEDETRYYISKFDTGAIIVGSCSEEQGSNSSIPDISTKR